jgi:hypothetical protein
MTVERAESLARLLLSQTLPKRWAHTRGVAAIAFAIAQDLCPEPWLLVAAAWLHDIGYAPAIASAGTGFHPLDGARHLRDQEHANSVLCRLVAHHSCAPIGASELGLAAELAEEFPAPPLDLQDALTYCDMTTGPDGQRMVVADRLVEICASYGPDHVVTRAITRSAPEITAAVNRVSSRLAAASAARGG